MIAEEGSGGDGRREKERGSGGRALIFPIKQNYLKTR